MKIIEIRTQEDFDRLPDGYKEYTEVHIKSASDVWLTITKTPENSNIVLMESSHAVLMESSHAVLRGSSHAELRGSSHAVLWESSHAVLWESSHAVLWGSSHAVLRGSSHAVLRESSHAVLWGSSHAELRESSHAVLWESSHAVLWESSHAVLRESSHAVLRESSHAVLRESSHAVLWESSHAELWGSSHAELSQNASGKIQDSTVVIEKLQHYATTICIDKECTIKQKDKTAQVIVCPRVLHDINSFTEIYKDNIQGKSMTLYKSVQSNNTDFYSGKIKYEGVVECPDWNPDENIQCGYGLHLSPTPELTQKYNVGKVLKCKVALEDIVVYPTDITKVRCRKVEVIEEVKI